MVKNTSGGKNTKKLKRNFGKYDAVDKIEQGQMFAQITKNNGGSFNVLCSDGIERLGKLSGYMKKGTRLSDGSYVVTSLRDFESDQKHCDIIAYGDPPNDIINVFKKNDPKSNKKACVEFVDDDDKFKDFEESSKTIKINVQEENNTIDTEKKTDDDNFDWDDI